MSQPEPTPSRKQKFVLLFCDLATPENVSISIHLMSLSSAFFGGALLVIIGQQTRSESLFYYFRIEEHIPEDHLLRLVDRHVDFAFVRETLKASYSHPGRPSIDPEVLSRILLIGYLYGITSERRLVEDVGMQRVADVEELFLPVQFEFMQDFRSRLAAEADW